MSNRSFVGFVTLRLNRAGPSVYETSHDRSPSNCWNQIESAFVRPKIQNYGEMCKKKSLGCSEVQSLQLFNENFLRDLENWVKIADDFLISMTVSSILSWKEKQTYSLLHDKKAWKRKSNRIVTECVTSGRGETRDSASAGVERGAIHSVVCW